MTVPAIVEERLEGEDVISQVPLGGDDELFVTPDRTLLYRAEGLLSGESVEVYPHEAERLSVNEGRRKCTVTLDHGLDGQSQFSVPADRFDRAIEPILFGVFSAAGITEPGETVQEVYRLGELTLVITDARVVKHVGNDLWDEEYESFPFESVTSVDIEEGSVSSQIIVEVDGRPQRIKTPRDDARRIRSEIQDGVVAYHDVATYDEFRRSVMEEREAGAVADAPVAEPAAGASGQPAEAGAVEDASEAGDEVDAGADEEPSPSGMVFGEGVGTVPVEEADGEDDVAAELTALRSAVERQNDLLRRQQQTVERLIRELQDDGD